jgi:phosphatidylserine/phosphatidylglycerophosphate/cardiolipin synthase-like enzyme
MVIDTALIIIGSFNYTGPATTLNDENIVVLGDLEETDDVAKAAQRRLATAALTEIDRIITDLGRPV